MKINTTIIKMNIESCTYQQISLDSLNTNKNEII